MSRMSDFKRITPEQVKEAYNITELKPMQGAFFPAEDCACGLGAIFAQKFGKPESQIEDGDVIGKLEDLFPEGYRLGFVHGFDEMKSSFKYNKVISETYNLGYEDGKASFEAVKKDVIYDGSIQDEYDEF
jgi:hypothetical protein